MSKRRSLLQELGYGSGGYTAAFTHPDPLDPNDRVRQKTQSRMDTYPYDGYEPYGQPNSVSDDGYSYDDGGLHRSLTPRYGSKPTDEAAGTPYMFGRSTAPAGNMVSPSPSARGWAGSTRDNLDIDGDEEIYGEDLDGGGLDGEVDLTMFETHPDLVECFAWKDRGVYDPMGPSLLETLESLQFDEEEGT